MDERTARFVSDAQRPADAKTPKDIAKLRSFLFKNQNHRFTDAEQQRLFEAVRLYAAAASTTTSSSVHPDEPDDSPALGLLEDALKMPFTVFTTSQKKALLKLLDRLQGDAQQQQQQQQQQPGPQAKQQQAAQARWTVLDLRQQGDGADDGGVVEVMNDAGDTQLVALAGCEPALVAELRAAWEAGEQACVVELQGAVIACLLLQ